jgi:hypothetical protein
LDAALPGAVLTSSKLEKTSKIPLKKTRKTFEKP